MIISSVACHDLEATEVRLIPLGKLPRAYTEPRYCLSIGGVELYGSLDQLAAVVQRARDRVAVARREQACCGPTGSGS